MDLSSNKFEGIDQEVEGMQAQNPSIKIIKNSKGYNYEYKILSLNVAEVEKIHDELEVLIKKWQQ